MTIRFKSYLENITIKIYILCKNNHQNKKIYSMYDNNFNNVKCFTYH